MTIQNPGTTSAGQRTTVTRNHGVAPNSSATASAARESPPIATEAG